ncbi:neutral/alkaline non-lysosomal ceramidase N-terminal domain-containing protein [Daejeonella lutea]|uniref:Neutral/alkaline non-lysosomal ceramidase, N-terminal n=1 Tax=Daejeonella lutea TaxID=572036 RepID=A0A1T5A6Z2_9SPHI|nr:neutral/alkaline non-lysosomal ceramidase N-terminal domain-containing protein [Daejeonella lutea]SKB30686.1 Neutral/alkaline non-lysosomal ceramidase, N-terminal [Daejeonella lutea]
MKIPGIYLTLFLLVVSITGTAQNNKSQTTSNSSWRVGVAKVIITPKQPMPMAGFASRTHSSEGKLHELWAKALVFEDRQGKRAVMVSSDLLGFPKSISDNIKKRIKTKYSLNPDQILLNSSHTHSGPVLGEALSDIYVLDNSQREEIKKYSAALEDMIVNMVGVGIRDLEPADVFAQNGVTRFQVNRRNNNAALLSQLSELQGPNDYAVPVIKAVNAKGDLKAVAFGYACHPTVLNGYQWSGDYPGFTQLELEKAHPGTTALFFQSAGADQNPLPRNTVPLAKQYGRELAAAVERVLEEDMRKLDPLIVTTYSELQLPLQAAPSEADLIKRAATTANAYEKRWAERMLAETRSGQKMITSYPYPVQVWTLGGLPVVSLGGELVVEYAIKVKQMLGPDSFVFGYSNDVMNYIPSSTILKEGGYEGDIAHVVYGMPSKWQTGIEASIMNEIFKLANEAGVFKNK